MSRRRVVAIINELETEFRQFEISQTQLVEQEVVVETPETPEVVVETPETPEVVVETPETPETPEVVPEETVEVPEVVVETPEETVEVPEVVVETPEVVVETPEVPEVVVEVPKTPEVVPEIPEEAVYTPIFSHGECSGISLIPQEPFEAPDTIEDFDKKIRDSIKSRNAPITELLVQEEVKPDEGTESLYRISKPYCRAPKMPNSR